MSFYDIDEQCSKYGCDRQAYAVRVTTGKPLRFLCYEHDREEVANGSQDVGEVRAVSHQIVRPSQADGPEREPASGDVHGESGHPLLRETSAQAVRGRKPALILAIVGVLVVSLLVVVKYMVSGNATGGGAVTGQECRQTNYELYNKSQARWTERFEWEYNQRGARPGSLDQVRQAVRNIVHNNTQCAGDRDFKAYASFTGKTTCKAKVDAYGRCRGGYDGHNTVSFGPLYNGALATTCVCPGRRTGCTRQTSGSLPT